MFRNEVQSSGEKVEEEEINKVQSIEEKVEEDIKKLNELSPIKGNHSLLNENVLSSKKLKIGSKNHDE